jgi:CRISPR-associated endonuclease Csn1
LDEPLTAYQIGRALFHINQRRGFKSNRKTDGPHRDGSRMREAVKKLRAELEESGARTIGEWLADRHRRREPVRFRALPGSGSRLDWAAYPARAMLEHEFEAIRRVQAEFHPGLLTGDAWDTLRRIIFRQRPLRPVDPGTCTLNPPDPRAPRCLPSAQRFRILQDLNNMRLKESFQAETRRLTLDERNRLLSVLIRGTDVKIKDIPRRLGLPRTTGIRLGIRVQKLTGDETAKKLRHPRALGGGWHSYSLEEMDEVVTLLRGDGRDAKVRSKLMDSFALSAERAERVLNSPLPAGHGRLGSIALGKLVREMEADVITYDEAARRAGYDHAMPFTGGPTLDRLPRYQEVMSDELPPVKDPHPADPYDRRMGRFSNPTVHIALNQLRRVTNALIRKHGTPSEVVLELGRELKQSKAAREATERRQRQYQERNEKADEETRALGLTPSGDTRIRYRLWLELGDDPLDRRCPYTGTQIGITMLFSDKVEVDHVLPFSRTLDNSVSNRTLCMREANQCKGNLTPAEAVELGHFEQSNVEAAAAKAPPNRAWRFGADAMDRFEGAEGQFLDRHLHETQWLGRLANRYMATVVGGDGVWVTPGRLTGLLRAKWGLNGLLDAGDAKNRNDHRHHAVDAAVIGVVDRALLQRVSTENRKDGEQGVRQLTISPPFESFRDEIEDHVTQAVVSHRVDHGTGGALHEDTAYGVVEGSEAEEGYTLVHRKPVESLTKGEVDRIRDARIREELKDRTAGVQTKGELSGILAEWSEETGVRRLRMLVKKRPFIRLCRGPRVYKGLLPGDNHHVQVCQMPDGAWCFRGVSRHEANQPGVTALPKGVREIMRLHKGDLVEVDDGSERIVKQIRQLEVKARRVRLAAHNEGGPLQKRHEAPTDLDPFRWDLLPFSRFRERNLRPVVVTETGRVVHKCLRA